MDNITLLGKGLKLIGVAIACCIVVGSFINLEDLKSYIGVSYIEEIVEYLHSKSSSID